MRAIDLFAGPGGWDVAARRLGIEALGVENDPGAVLTRMANDLSTVAADVSALDPAGFSSPDILIGSPPCPPFSAQGRGEGLTTTRGQLVWEPLRWADLHRPPLIALEQVPPAEILWRKTAIELRKMGYTAWTGVLNSADYGVGQKRRRAILMASLGKLHLPEATHAKNGASVGLKEWVTMAECLGLTRRTVRWAVPGGDPEWPFKHPAPTVSGTFEPDVLAPPTMRLKGDPPRQKTPGAVRVTHAQAAHLQSFPKEHRWRGSTASRWQQVGNAVPPLLAEAVLGALVR